MKQYREFEKVMSFFAAYDIFEVTNFMNGHFTLLNRGLKFPVSL